MNGLNVTAIALASSLVFAGCAIRDAALDAHESAAGISRKERAALSQRSHWGVLDANVPQYSEMELKTLFYRSLQPLDAETAALHSTVLSIALADVGDVRFAATLKKTPVAVRRAVARNIQWLWQGYGLEYPRTQAVLRGV